MKFINRVQELRRLDHAVHLNDGGLVVIWGRRRVGKTRLLLEWAKKHKGVYYTADESAPSVQRKYFALALEQVFPGFGSVEYPDWTTLLMRLAREAIHTGWKGPLIIDELPYLVSMSPEFPSVLQKFIDLDAREAKLVVALCGSSQRMMQGAVLEPSAPLYGRANEIIKLGPISVGYMGEALEINNPREIIESYAIWGGVPRYWELIKNKGGTLLEHIDRIVLDPMGPLHDEPNRVLLEEIPSAISLRPILDSIGLGAHRLSEIASRIGQPATSLARPMQRLIELDLVTKEIPFRTLEHHSKRTLYKIKDPFIRFWFDVVASRRSYFAQTLPANRQKWLKENLQSLFPSAWEEICRLAVPLLSQEWGEPFFCQAGRYWHGQGPEWDILADSLDGGSLLVGEAKWISKIPSIHWVNKTVELIKAKGLPVLPHPYPTKIVYALFIPERPLHLDLPINVRVIDAADVIRVLRQ